MDRDNFVQVVGALSVWIGGTITSMRIVEHYRHRQRLTDILQAINIKVQSSRLVASPERILKNNRIFCIIAWATIFGVFVIAVFSCTLTIKSVFTEQQYFSLALPFVRPTFSWKWWCEAFFIQIVIFYCGLFFSVMEGIVLDMCLQLAFLFRVEFDKIQALSSSDPHCMWKLKASIEELVQLKW